VSPRMPLPAFTSVVVPGDVHRRPPIRRSRRSCSSEEMPPRQFLSVHGNTCHSEAHPTVYVTWPMNVNSCSSPNANSTHGSLFTSMQAQHAPLMLSEAVTLYRHVRTSVWHGPLVTCDASSVLVRAPEGRRVRHDGGASLTQIKQARQDESHEGERGLLGSHSKLSVFAMAGRGYLNTE
jgi:hypothetical protein